MRSCNVIQPCDVEHYDSLVCQYCDVISNFCCVFAALTADYGAAGGDHHPQWAAVRGADTTGLSDRDQNHLQNMEVSSEDI